MQTGWIKLYRKLLSWEWYTDSNMVHLLIHLTLSANHKDGSWRGTIVKRGQLITGRKQLSSQTGISEQSIRTCLERLESTSEITSKPTNKFTVITICNYDEYQSEQLQTNQQNSQQLTSNQPTTNQLANQQLTTNKNEEKLKNEKITPLPPRKPGVDCPVDEIVNLYREICVSFPGIKKLTDQRKKKLRVRWREDKERQNLEWWRSFFTIAAGSSFLCGESGKWRADFDFLLREDKMVKIIEGGFDNSSPQQAKGEWS